MSDLWGFRSDCTTTTDSYKDKYHWNSIYSSACQFVTLEKKKKSLTSNEMQFFFQGIYNPIMTIYFGILFNGWNTDMSKKSWRKLPTLLFFFFNWQSCSFADELWRKTLEKQPWLESQYYILYILFIIIYYIIYYIILYLNGSCILFGDFREHAHTLLISVSSKGPFQKKRFWHFDARFKWGKFSTIYNKRNIIVEIFIGYCWCVLLTAQ